MRAVLVAGGSGTAGGAIARRLASLGAFAVHATQSPGSNGAVSIETGIEPHSVDLADREAVDDLFDAVKPDVVVSAVMGRGDDGAANERAMAENLITAAQRSNVSVFVYISVFRAEAETGIEHFDVKHGIEKHLRASGLPFVIIRPATFMDSLFSSWFLKPVHDQGTLVSPFAPGTRISYVHTDDIANLVAATLGDRASWGQTYTIGGPEALTIADIQGCLGRHLNKPLGYRRIQLSDVRSMMGEPMARMVEHFNTHDFVVPANDLPPSLDLKLTSFDDLLAREVENGTRA